MIPPASYKQHFIDKQDERLELFRLLANRYSVQSAMYPGSFLHITPSFVIPEVVYIDSDRRGPAFFNDPALRDYIEARKVYERPATVRFHKADYQQPLAEPDQSVDLLLSQYAGFISQPCKRYLKIGGVLLANNSHGDAALAQLDEDFRFVAAITRRGDRFTLREADLDQYFVPKKAGLILTRDSIIQSGRGIGYTRPAFSYVFERIS